MPNWLLNTKKSSKSPAPDPKLEAELPGDLKQNLQRITRHGGRTSAIVRGMPEHARTGTGEKQPTDHNALANDYLKIACHGQRAKETGFNCELATNFSPDLANVEVAPPEIGRVLLNLSTNAFYAVHEKQKPPAPTRRTTRRGSYTSRR